VFYNFNTCRRQAKSNKKKKWSLKKKSAHNQHKLNRWSNVTCQVFEANEPATLLQGASASDGFRGGSGICRVEVPRELPLHQRSARNGEGKRAIDQLWQLRRKYIQHVVWSNCVVYNVNSWPTCCPCCNGIRFYVKIGFDFLEWTLFRAICLLLLQQFLFHRHFQSYPAGYRESLQTVVTPRHEVSPIKAGTVAVGSSITYRRSRAGIVDF
jgi:hypothetical protein